MDATTRTRSTAPSVFGTAYSAVADDERCTPLAARIRTHAVEVACMARELAPLVDADAGDAFAAGLLHDIGQLLLLHRDPAGYVDILTGPWDHVERLRVEKDRYGTDHALLGAEHLLDQRMPDAVADAVADHHDPFVSSATTTIVVAAADELLGADASRRRAVRMLEVDVADLSSWSEQ